MAKIDEIKEFLTTLRVFFTVSIAIMVAVGGNLIKSYRNNIHDTVFFLGFTTEIILAIMVIIIVKKIRKKTKEIGDL